MKRLTKSEVRNLLTVDTPPCVSIYIPLEQARIGEQVVGTYKRLLDTAQELLRVSYSESVTQRILEPLKKVSFRDFAEVRSGTLVLFKSPTIEGYVLVPKSLPGLTIVSDSFHLKPLLEFLIPFEEFHLLSLASDSVKFYRGDGVSFEVLREFTLGDDSFERIVETSGGRGGLRSVFHRFLLSIGFSRARLDVRRFYSQIDKHVLALLQGSRAPLLLAGKRRDTRLYRAISGYRGLARPSLPYPIDADRGVELESLHESAMALANRHHREERKKVLREFQAASRRNLVRLGVESVVNALQLGRVKTLIFRKDEVSWGTVNWNTGLVVHSPYQRNAHDDDLIDDCIERAVTLGCKIVALEKYQMPNLGPLAAILKPEPEVEKRISVFTYPRPRACQKPIALR